MKMQEDARANKMELGKKLSPASVDCSYKGVYKAEIGQRYQQKWQKGQAHAMHN